MPIEANLWRQPFGGSVKKSGIPFLDSTGFFCDREYSVAPVARFEKTETQNASDLQQDFHLKGQQTSELFILINIESLELAAGKAAKLEQLSHLPWDILMIVTVGAGPALINWKDIRIAAAQNSNDRSDRGAIGR